ncbi:DUF2971 domain-containing protein [Phenylobacterium sp.]|uniref:DUF2971 domain-containing protein n=1 Tax=Phenylobacterium sp. TaxID=1871053 RepID=UPI0025F1F8F9|nr:DUF2971 domain-containing protein [Phenylobacterium sp.]MBX3482404.1 DUF2971 domain-containing protein [Phenylobacterium sp.]MCW5758198.1 DUF2971 domain-containing protein [Phenylobacterium sp.]
MLMSPKSKPRRIYKYRAFSALSLEMLVEDKLFFADPSTFNDPLDAKPSFETDLPVPDLEGVLRKLVERRVTDEMQSAARKIRYRGPRTVEHIEKHARRAAEDLLADIRYNATNPDYEIVDPLQYLLGEHVHQEVIRRYDRGIVSFAKRANCPLMWSHYGDQHRGVCIGYSAPADVKLEPVAYGGDRSVRASIVKAMVDGDAEAARRVDDAVLLKKARDWRYEREWRLIGDRGLRDSPLELEEVVFGMRCPLAVQFAVAKALAERDRAVKLYEVRQKRGTFLLHKASADMDEILATWPRRARSIQEAFAEIVLSDDSAAPPDPDSPS